VCVPSRPCSLPPFLVLYLSLSYTASRSCSPSPFPFTFSLGVVYCVIAHWSLQPICSSVSITSALHLLASPQPTCGTPCDCHLPRDGIPDESKPFKAEKISWIHKWLDNVHTPAKLDYGCSSANAAFNYRLPIGRTLSSLFPSHPASELDSEEIDRPFGDFAKPSVHDQSSNLISDSKEIVRTENFAKPSIFGPSPSDLDSEEIDRMIEDFYKPPIYDSSPAPTRDSEEMDRLEPFVNTFVPVLPESSVPSGLQPTPSTEYSFLTPLENTTGCSSQPITSGQVSDTFLHSPSLESSLDYPEAPFIHDEPRALGESIQLPYPSIPFPETTVSGIQLAPDHASNLSVDFALWDDSKGGFQAMHWHSEAPRQDYPQYDLDAPQETPDSFIIWDENQGEFQALSWNAPVASFPSTPSIPLIIPSSPLLPSFIPLPGSPSPEVASLTADSASDWATESSPSEVDDVVDDVHVKKIPGSPPSFDMMLPNVAIPTNDSPLDMPTCTPRSFPLPSWKVCTVVTAVTFVVAGVASWLLS
jgi:hypothetical protein